jgi:hypothetical protein
METEAVKRIVRYWGRDVVMLATVILALILLLGDTRGETKRQCERSREFAPYLALYFETHRVMPPDVLVAYRATIPKHC